MDAIAWTPVVETWLPQLEASLTDSELAIAVVTIAAVAGRTIDLDDDELRAASRRALFVLIELAADSSRFAHVSEVVHALLDAPESAWRAYACSLLAEQLADDDVDDIE